MRACVNSSVSLGAGWVVVHGNFFPGIFTRITIFYCTRTGTFLDACMCVFTCPKGSSQPAGPRQTGEWHPVRDPAAQPTKQPATTLLQSCEGNHTTRIRKRIPNVCSISWSLPPVRRPSHPLTHMQARTKRCLGFQPAHPIWPQ